MHQSKGRECKVKNAHSKKHLFLGIFSVCKHFFKTIVNYSLTMANFAIVIIFYINKLSFNADNVKTIKMFSLRIMTDNV